jgi:tetratricopeptide (TPR) repeat protein
MKLNKSVVGAVAAVSALAVVMYLSDRPVETRDGVVLPRTRDEYEKLNKDSSELVLEIFGRADAGIEVTDADRNKLKDAIKKFEAMKAYEPRQVAALFGSGKCYMLLGENQLAADRLAQAWENRMVDPQKELEAVRLTAIEAAALASEATLELAAQEVSTMNTSAASGQRKEAEDSRKKASILYQRAFSLADDAVKLVPTAPRYLAARGQALLAVGRKDDAKADLSKALRLDANSPKVKQLAKLLQ